jgi:DNA-binding transcriptional LysR family regulator
MGRRSRVVVAAGHRLAHHDELSVADILEEPFPGSPSLHPKWTAFWTLDAQRGGPPRVTNDDVATAEDGLEVVAAGRAIATVPAGVANGLAHPGVVALPLRDGSPVQTRLLWHSDD